MARIVYRLRNFEAESVLLYVNVLPSILKTSQRSIAILLGVLFLLSQGHHLLMEQVLRGHRQMVRQQMRSSKANRILLLTQEQWEKAEKVKVDEIRLNGKLFDIKSMHCEKGQVILYGHFDTKEDRLLASSRMLDDQQNVIKKSGFTAFFFFEAFPVMPCFRTEYPEETSQLMTACHFLTRVVPVDAPPPRSV